MLTHLTVRHLAVVEDIAIDFSSGMTSLTGETGAGKSILVDALGWVLGDRADSKSVRHGCERAEIEASFDLTHNPALHAWLVAAALDEDQMCHLRRVIPRDGASKAYINGRMVSLNQLRELGECAVDIHGQHAHQSLLRPEVQREMLDELAGNTTLLAQLRQAFQNWQAQRQKLVLQQQHNTQNLARLELLNYQIEELEVLRLEPEHLQQLLQDQRQLSHAQALIGRCQSALADVFENEPSPYEQISRQAVEFEKLLSVEPRFAAMLETFQSALIHLDETASAIRHYLDRVDMDPERLQAIEQELSELHQLARKHHTDIESLPQHYQALCEERKVLLQANDSLATLQQSIDAAAEECATLAQEIRANRARYAPQLSTQITAAIQQLAMPTGTLEFRITPLAEITEHGQDAVKIWVSTNPGQAPGELAKVASGGELARISLAIQVITASHKRCPTLIFDEVDVGIGGAVAEIVGRHLRELASDRQVISITHLPQVAAQAHHHLQVAKHWGSDHTWIEIRPLGPSERIDELARMLGGTDLTDKTRSHAAEMLERAQA